MENNQLVLIAFGVVAFVALGYMIYRQMNSGEDADDKSEVSESIQGQKSLTESDSYYDDSEIYSD